MFKKIAIILAFIPLSTSGMETSKKFHYSDHVFKRMAKRKIDKKDVRYALEHGIVVPSTQQGYSIYCSDKKGKLHVVVYDADRTIVTVYYSKEDEVLSAKARDLKAAKAAQETIIKMLEGQGITFIEPSSLKDIKNLEGKERDIALHEARDKKYRDREE